MDIVIIGKDAFSHSAKPHVVYCGQSRDEGLAAVAKLNGKFPNCYFIDAQLPYQRIPIYPSEPSRTVAAPVVPVQVTGPADSPQPKKPKSK